MKHIVPNDFQRYRVSAVEPCPICEKPDWCLSDHFSWALCQRIESDQRWKHAGFFHRLDDGHSNSSSMASTRPVAAPKPIIEKIVPWMPPGNPVALYYYNRPDGSSLYRKVRYKTPTGKVTPYERYDAGRDVWIGGAGCMHGVERVLYRNEQISSRERVFVVEGEKAADLLWDLGIMATCADSGAGHWRPEYSMILAGKDCVILPDNDASGRKHADLVARSLLGLVRSIKILELPGLGPKQDVFDWLTQNGESL